MIKYTIKIIDENIEGLYCIHLNELDEQDFTNLKAINLSLCHLIVQWD